MDQPEAQMTHYLSNLKRSSKLWNLIIERHGNGQRTLTTGDINVQQLFYHGQHMQLATWSREDYREMLELVVMFLGGVVKRVR